MRLLAFLFVSIVTFAQNTAAVNVPFAGLHGEVVLGSLSAANFNTTTDQAISINSSKYVITRIHVYGASVSLTTAVGGFYTATSKGGTNLVAATQIYTGLTASTKIMTATLAAVVSTDIRTETTLYLSLTTAQGATATGKVVIYGIPLL